MRAAIVAFVAVFGLTQSLVYNGWNKEFDLVDLAKMDIKSEWDSWKSTFAKTYESVEEEYKRFGLFVESLQKVATMNSNGMDTARYRPNQFSDLSGDEFASYAHGYNGKRERLPILNRLKPKLGNDGANPASIDWTTQGVVTPVKNQGNCGSCWAFSATGSTECRYAISTGKLNSLSEQQLVDCTRGIPYGNLGCSGGEMDSAFKYIEATGGLCSESEYPYTAKNGNCDSSSCGTFYDPIKSYTDVTTRDESALETATVSGCVSVAIEADQTAFQYYSSGVLTGNCGTNLDHGVLVVGYGTESGTEYWKVKNSWGVTWGEQGYVLICKDCNKNGNQGECGINDDPSYPNA
jgi:C1A family cysteine protease